MSSVIDTRESLRDDAEYRPREPVDIFATLGVLRRGAGDPTHRSTGHRVWLGLALTSGDATLSLVQSVSGVVTASAWGTGRDEALAGLATLLGAHDSWHEFDDRGVRWLSDARRRCTGLRLCRTGRVVEQLIPLALEQKVTAVQAFRAYARLVRQYGRRAPGPHPDLFVPPSAETWRAIPSWEWHRAGAEPFQSRTAVLVAQRASSIERAVALASSGAHAEQVLCSLPGIGAWTANEVRARALGDADAVSVGDYHLASVVGYAFTGHRDVDDDGMLELLEPWRGHRQRVIRLISAAGPRKPRRGPRMTIEDHRNR